MARHAGTLPGDGAPSRLIGGQQEMIRRRDGVVVTMAKFKDAPFKWGSADCSRLVAFHLKGAGYKVAVAKGGSYKSLLGARRALARCGYSTIGEALDAIGLPRIPPAAALEGDIIEVPSENSLGSLTIFVGNGRVIGWHPDAEGAAILQPVDYVSAWRVKPL